jgi:hypothetical protein
MKSLLPGRRAVVLRRRLGLSPGRLADLVLPAEEPSASTTMRSRTGSLRMKCAVERPTGDVALSGVATRCVAVVDLSRDGLQRECLPDPSVMWWPRSEAPSTAVGAGRPGCRSPRTNDARRAAFGLHSPCWGARRQAWRSPRARTGADEVCGPPAASLAVVVRPLRSSAAHRPCPVLRGHRCGPGPARRRPCGSCPSTTVTTVWAPPSLPT